MHVSRSQLSGRSQRRVNTPLLIIAALSSLAAWSTPADESSTSWLQINLETAVPVELTGELILLPAEGEDAAAHRTPFRGRSIVLDGRPSSSWMATVVAERFWSPGRLVTFPPMGGSTTFSLTLFPLADVEGTIEVPDEHEVPTVIELRVESPPARPPSAVPRGTVFECSPKPTGQFRCSIPATALHLAISAPGFAPEYRWGVTTDVRASTELGRIRLRPGGSLIAWLDDEFIKEIESLVGAKLYPLTSGPAHAGTETRAQPVARGLFDSNGVLQLKGLAPGVYRLQLTASEYAPENIHPIEIFEGRESNLRKPIKLSPFANHSLIVDPPRDPHGKPWTIRLRKLSDYGGLPTDESFERSAVTDQSGRARFERNQPGRFDLLILDSEGERYHLETIHITQPETVVELPLDRLKGRVTVGDQPVAATLWFGLRQGAVSIEVETDEKGGFEAILPRRSSWPVEVEPLSDPSPVIVEVIPKAETDIQLLDTFIRGTVLTKTGDPVARAMAELMSGTQVLSRMTDEGGHFRFRAVPGLVQLTARNLRTGEVTAPVQMEVFEGVELPPIELIFESNRNVAGYVRIGDQSVPGALVNVYGGGRSKKTVTDQAGFFVTKVTESADHGLVVVSAPARVLQSFEVDYTSGVLDLNIEPQGGTLVLHLPPESRNIRIHRWSTSVPLLDFGQWAADYGANVHSVEELAVPYLAPGMYTVCVSIPLPERAEELCGGAQVLPGMTADLVLERKRTAGDE